MTDSTTHNVFYAPSETEGEQRDTQETSEKAKRSSPLNVMRETVEEDDEEELILVEEGEEENQSNSTNSEPLPVVLRLRNLEKSYPIAGTEERVIALRNVNLCEDCGSAGFPPIRRGEFVMIRGPSGGGKTTLLNIIGTIDTPTRGTVELFGVSVSRHTPDAALAELRLKNIGFVFQTFNLIATMTAVENVELPMTLLGHWGGRARRLRACRLLSLVGLRNRTHHLPSELSGGEQQRVTIARSLANSPQLLLLDEPTGDLDTINTIDVMDLLLRLNRLTKTTCIMVTHNPDVECYADRIFYVSDSRFVKEVRNRRPRRLVYEAYVKNLEKRERETTMATISFDDSNDTTTTGEAL